jgi:hypothetical protein
MVPQGVKMKITAIIISVVMVFSAVTYLFVKEVMITKPSTCEYCHFMTPFYNKWARSTHNKVRCLKCHEYGPFKAFLGQLRFIAGTYNPRPLTNVPDAKCLQAGCHERRLIESKVSLSKPNIVFDHKPHFTEYRKGITLHCRSCHSDIVQGEHMKVSLNVCFLCHLSGGKFRLDDRGCLVCHNEPKKNGFYRGVFFNHLRPRGKEVPCSDCHVSVTMGDGQVPKEKCFFCHVDRTEKYSDVVFVHQQHVARKQIDCFFCHQLIEHGNIRMSNRIEALLK